MVDRNAKATVIDWEASTAIASGQGPVYVLAEGSERDRIAHELERRLDGLETPDGVPVVRNARLATDIYDGPHVDQGPDLVLKQAPNVHIEGKIGAEDVFVKPDRWRGENKDRGMFVAYGPNIDAEATLSDMHILDIAPTILHLHGRPVPEELDGRVRMELFASGTDPSAREISFKEASWLGSLGGEARSVDGSVEDRLGELGYLE
jgi:predicted AlkP superfamily phosphohydrolase/phosphomutase